MCRSVYLACIHMQIPIDMTTFTYCIFALGHILARQFPIVGFRPPVRLIDIIGRAADTRLHFYLHTFADQFEPTSVRRVRRPSRRGSTVFRIFPSRPQRLTDDFRPAVEPFRTRCHTRVTFPRAATRPASRCKVDTRRRDASRSLMSPIQPRPLGIRCGGGFKRERARMSIKQIRFLIRGRYVGALLRNSAVNKYAPRDALIVALTCEASARVFFPSTRTPLPRPLPPLCSLRHRIDSRLLRSGFRPTIRRRRRKKQWATGHKRARGGRLALYW